MPPIKTALLDAIRHLDKNNAGVALATVERCLKSEFPVVTIAMGINSSIKDGSITRDKNNFLRLSQPAPREVSTVRRSLRSAEAGQVLESASLIAEVSPTMRLPSLPTQASTADQISGQTPGVNIFIFHRDLRVDDNSALLSCRKPCIPIFVFTPQQIDPLQNPYFSHACVQFMCESLFALDLQLQALGSRLHLFYGDTDQVLSRIHEKFPIGSVSQNRDFTPFALKRDQRIKEWCQERDVRFHDAEDYDIIEPAQLLLPDGRPYGVFSAYFSRLVKERPVRAVSDRHLVSSDLAPLPATLEDLELPSSQMQTFYIANPNLVDRGGRPYALSTLDNLAQFKSYEEHRNFPALDGTTKLSAHLKFGTISAREFYWAAMRVYGTPSNALTRELAFRSFYLRLCIHRPAISLRESFRQSIDTYINWMRSEDPKYAKYWNAWITGTTGFPLADAGIRELNATGRMHGRVRMVSATLLTRYLLIDWREGAKYFAQKLTDYDPCSNNLGWQFSAALGENAQNIFRFPMNPLLQSEKFDKDAAYIKKWIPELRGVSAKDIHKCTCSTTAYPKPIVNAKEASARAVQLWKEAANSSGAFSKPQPESEEDES